MIAPKILTSKIITEIGERFRGTADQILTVIFSATSKKYKGINPPNHEFLGTGFLVTDGTYPFVITARHVFESSPIRENFFHSVGTDNAFPLCSIYTMSADKELDIAIMGCFERPLSEAGISPLPIEILSRKCLFDENALYYCGGYPGQFSTHIPFLKELSVKSHPIIGRHVELPKGFDPKKHFAFEYPKGIDPRGMSGSPIWTLGLEQISSLNEWQPENAGIAGMAIQWLPDISVLIGTRIDQIDSFVKPALNHLIESNGWKDGNEVH